MKLNVTVRWRKLIKISKICINYNRISKKVFPENVSDNASAQLKENLSKVYGFDRYSKIFVRTKDTNSLR